MIIRLREKAGSTIDLSNLAVKLWQRKLVNKIEWATDDPRVILLDFEYNHLDDLIAAIPSEFLLD